MRDPESVERFVRAAQQRLNRALWWRTLARAGALAGAVLLVVGAAYVLQGYEVPGWTYPLVGAAALAAAGVAWGVQRYGDRAAARFVDERFQLQDAVTSCLAFRRRGEREGLYALQAADTARRVETLDPSAVRLPSPARAATAAVLLLGLAAALGFKAPSPAVLEARRLAADTEAQTAALNEELAREVEEMLEELEEDDAEDELVDGDELREWIEELETTADQKEALRQYAKVEQEVREASERLARQRDERTLARAAEELQKAPESKRLGEKLEAEDYEAAAEDLEELGEELDEDPEARREKLERLKATSQRLAEGARRARREMGEQAQQSGHEGGEEERELDESLERLEEEVEELERSLEEHERQERQRGECDGACRKAGDAAGKRTQEELEELARALREMDAREEARRKLAGLRKKLGSCQSRLTGQRPGGKQAGQGSDPTRRDPAETEEVEGDPTALEGTKNAGPSQTKVEEASSGSGTSARRGGSGERRAFRREVESFVEREDVPTPVRRGVKAYFEDLSRSESEEGEASASGEEGR